MVALINTSKPSNDDLVAALQRIGTWAVPEQIRAALPFSQRVALGLQPIRNRLLTLYRDGTVERRLLNGKKYTYHAKPPAPVTVDRMVTLEHLCKTILPLRWNSATGMMATLLHNAVMSSHDRLEQRYYLLSADCISFPIGMADRKAVIRVTRTERKCRYLP